MSRSDQPSSAPFKLTALDRAILSQTDEEFQPHTWENLKTLIAENRLDLLTRNPSDLKRYIKWTAAVKAHHGSVANFVLKERLKWEVIPSETTDGPPKFEVKNREPFADENDYKILPNDWPYGLEPGITHLCVWVKTPLEIRPEDGDMTDDARELVDKFVTKKFREKLRELEGDAAEDRVLWFKNWVSLQSVRGVDHVHVLIRDAPLNLLNSWTGPHARRESIEAVAAVKVPY
ncbi:hypothetical protein M501DRAFT_943939 [Patellaria atrata CBS 101060]|uniref:N-acetylglucosamine-induced protein 1 n=1 Tax=Patellaria atrata CBS 101060 TaxID=1346257 RepID=A0A9P4S3F3_9PEZI|nr:hypothetical protein M501DRAFT_943939 [Patellaria atrata CBS 101060]